MSTKANTAGFKANLFAGALALMSPLAVASCASDPPPPPATPAPVTETAPPAEAPPAEVAQEAPAAPAPECEAAEDCGKSKGDAPAGNEWICDSGACATRALPEPVKADPPAEEAAPAKAKKKATAPKAKKAQ
jgi:hypothetical protein